MYKYWLLTLELFIISKNPHSKEPKINITLNVENIINIELKKLAQYWKNIMFKYDLGKTLLNVFLLLNWCLETENLYNIVSEINSNINKNVIILFDKNIIGTKIIKFNIAEK